MLLFGKQAGGPPQRINNNRGKSYCDPMALYILTMKRIAATGISTMDGRRPLLLHILTELRTTVPSPDGSLSAKRLRNSNGRRGGTRLGEEKWEPLVVMRSLYVARSPVPVRLLSLGVCGDFLFRWGRCFCVVLRAFIVHRPVRVGGRPPTSIIDFGVRWIVNYY